MLKWKSNHQQVADREYFIGRVRNGALEMVSDHKAGTFVGIYLDAENTPPEYSDTILTFEATNG